MRAGSRRGRGERILVDALNADLATAEREVVFVTPYFVPRPNGVARLRALRTLGVDVTLITNSLASTNHAVVHGGYAPYRRDLLEACVRLHEARPDTAMSRITGAPARLTLHAKCVVIDRSRALAGSLNLDPRSIEFNTEMGIFVDSATFAGPSTTPSRRTCPATPRPCGSTPNAACSGKPARDTTGRSGAAIPAPRSAGGSFRAWCPPCPSSKTSSEATGRFRSQRRLKIR